MSRGGEGREGETEEDEGGTPLEDAAMTVRNGSDPKVPAKLNTRRSKTFAFGKKTNFTERMRLEREATI